MAGHVLAERAAFVQTLRRTDPDARTLCGDWDAAQLTAHLVLRERSARELAGRVPRPAFQRLAQRGIDAYVASRSYSELVDDFAAGPPVWSPWVLPPVREAVNLLEYLVHHEDVRRARDSAVPRELAADVQDAVWTRLRVSSRLTLRQVPQGVRLIAPGRGEIVSRPKASRVVTVTGDPVELALVTMGRQRVAVVRYDGDPGDVASFSGARIAL